MSIEQTLQNIADALLKVAEANQAIAAASLKTEESYRASIGAYAAATAAGAPLTTTIEQDVTKVETDAKAEQKKVMAAVEADRKPTTAKEAVADALSKAKADKEAAAKKAESETATQNAQSQGAGQGSDDPLDAAPLDWDKDVRPALLAVGKDRDALVKLMAKYDVPKGGKAPTEKWADLLAEANAIVAARG